MLQAGVYGGPSERAVALADGFERATARLRFPP
jgi:hypothetical protein